MKEIIYEAVIGLEVHVQLKTDSKIFCSCSTEYTLDPNINVCPVCAGFPGVLPLLNEKAKRFTLRTALALNCKINRFSQFARKQYFYPDLPKNYQISQYNLPLAEKGFLDINLDSRTNKRIGIHRVHLEEDAGKLLHYIGSQALDHSLVDLNRSGTPLMEIVSDPALNSSEEAFYYLQELKSLLQYIEVSDCNMEEGSLRCDANVSIKEKGARGLGVKTELKNMNSFRAVRKALDYEIKRQKDVLNEGGKVIQETRLWEEKAEVTHSMRRKEEAHDYRYFPEPDLLPLVIEEREIEEIKKSIPETPARLKERFKSQYGLSDYDISVLAAEKELAEFYEAVVEEYSKKKLPTEKNYKMIANWVTGEFKAGVKEASQSISDCPVKSDYLAGLIIMIEENRMPENKAKKELKEAMGLKTGKAHLPASVEVITDDVAIKQIVQEVLAENEDITRRIRQGEEKPLGFLVGQVMQKSKGRANPNLVNKILREELKK